MSAEVDDAIAEAIDKDERAKGWVGRGVIASKAIAEQLPELADHLENELGRRSYKEAHETLWSVYARIGREFTRDLGDS